MKKTLQNSNTTLVKVKLVTIGDCYGRERVFKYNTC